MLVEVAIPRSERSGPAPINSDHQGGTVLSEVIPAHTVGIEIPDALYAAASAFRSHGSIAALRRLARPLGWAVQKVQGIATLYRPSEVGEPTLSTWGGRRLSFQTPTYWWATDYRAIPVGAAAEIVW